MGLDNPLHIAFLVVILLLVFGAKRLPEIGRSLGSGMREFKDSITGSSSDTQQPALTQSTQAPAPPVQAPAQTVQAPAQTVQAPAQTVQAAPAQTAAPAPEQPVPATPEPAQAEPTHQA
jgi:sec-independent protein translocase protein TatA